MENTKKETHAWRQVVELVDNNWQVEKEEDGEKFEELR